MNLKEVIQMVIESCKNQLIPSPDSILDVSARIYISENINQSKKENIHTIQTGKEKNIASINQGKASQRHTSFPSSGEVSNSSSHSPDNAPTIKQINLLRKLGLAESELPTTKKEAWIMINEIKKEKEEY